MPPNTIIQTRRRGNMKNRNIYGYIIVMASVLCTSFIIFIGLSLMNDTEFKVGDIVATVVIILSLVIAIVIAVCCRCNKRHKQNSKKIIVDREATYIPVAKIMGSDCGVCLDTKDSRMGQIVKLHCNHTFHQKCMTESLKSQTKCPLCRQRVKQFTPSQRIFAYFQTKINQYRYNYNNEQDFESNV